MNDARPPTIERLIYDRWERTPVFDLEPGDIIRQGDVLAVVQSDPYRENGAIQVPGEQYNSGPIKLCLGGTDMESITRVMDYVGSDLHEFPDDTAMIADLERGPGHIFSPRLSLASLEVFCRENIKRYEAFYQHYQGQIDNGGPVAMTPFWDDTKIIE